MIRNSQKNNVAKGEESATITLIQIRGVYE